MKRLFYIIFFLCSCMVVYAQNTSTVTLEPGSGITINRNIYGHFAEHLGRCIYDGFYKDGKIRMDVVDALKKIQVPLLRWPGGCFADNYHWRDGVGKKSKRPGTVNMQWGMVPEDNSFGTDEFMQLCSLIGCEPYMAANVGTGTPQELESWVEYLNYDGKSAMTLFRKKNGHPAPYHVTYWGIGNESWGCGGRMKPEYYAMLFRQFAQFCKSYPGTPVRRVVGGANADDYNWTEQVMKNIQLRFAWGLSMHYYCEPVKANGDRGFSTGFDEQEYFSAMASCLKMEELINKHSAIMDKYDPDKKVALVVDEWGISTEVEPGTNPDFLYQQNSLRDALIAGTTLNIFNNHCDRVRMANLAQAVNVLQALILTHDDTMLLTPTYHVFDLYKVHQDAKRIPVQIASPYYKFGKDSIPSVNVSASEDSNNIVHISLVNLDPLKSIPVNLNIAALHYTTVNGNLLTSSSFADINTFARPNTVSIKPFNGFEQKGKSLNIELPAKSIVVLELK